MIIIKLMGGLGNQLFQYALGRHLALKNNTQLKLDISFLNKHHQCRNFTHRNYVLENLNIKAGIASPGEVLKVKTHLYYKEKEVFRFDPFVFSLGKTAYIEGYWQNEKYFNEITEVLRNDFTIVSSLDKKSLRFEREILNSQSVSIHIRRGDYVNIKKTKEIHGTCVLEYYYNCMKYISQSFENPIFFIFSDDPDWVGKNFKSFYKQVIIDCNDIEMAHHDLYLMSICRHNIIANSSFSWWGGWLNRNPGKIVCAPRQWFASGGYDTRGLIPNEWILFENVSPVSDLYSSQGLFQI